jgi:hypothetical protein
MSDSGSNNSIPIDDDDTQPTYALNTNILDLVEEKTRILADEYPHEPLSNIVYTLVLAVVRSPLFRKTNGSMVADILVYYLECYKRYRISQEPETDPTVFINTAGIALLDLYILDAHNQTKRKLAELIAASIREHWIDRVVKDDSIEGTDEFNIVNNLTLLSTTLPFYTARPRRAKNLAYVAWLETTFTKLFETGNARMLIEAPDVLHVLDQILKRKKIITIHMH